MPQIDLGQVVGPRGVQGNLDRRAHRVSKGLLDQQLLLMVSMP